MPQKSTFLLTNAITFDFVEPLGFYDASRKINVCIVNGKKRPLVSQSMSPITESKTMAAPGDDDPDPEDERCY